VDKAKEKEKKRRVYKMGGFIALYYIASGSGYSAPCISIDRSPTRSSRYL
jgi:hypothetical protein